MLLQLIKLLNLQNMQKKGLDVLITISLDGDEETHDKLRGVKGNYQKCVKLYDKLKSRY